MIVPGSNLLGMALNLIAQQTVRYYKDLGRFETDDGEFITQLAEGVDVSGCSVQAVDRMKYAEAGLEQSKSYWLWYTQSAPSGVQRGKSGDIVEVFGRRLQVASDQPWYGLDGWTGTLLVDIGPATGQLTSPYLPPK